MAEKNKHHHDISSSLLHKFAIEAIQEDEVTSPTGGCPSKSQVQSILSNNDFKNASEIADDYQQYIESEDWDKEALMHDLRDPDGSWLADNELKFEYNWTDEQASKFKQLVLKLIVERQTRLNVRSKHKSVMQSLLQKTQSSSAFSSALEKSAKKELAHVESDPLSAMPTYINRAIWYRSDDENLERLVDRAVKEVVQLKNIWIDSAFVKNIYSDDTFGASVEKIFELKFHFFDRFVQERYKRQLQLRDLFDESGEDKVDEKEENGASFHKSSSVKICDYVAYFMKKEKKKVMKELDIMHEEKETEEEEEKEQKDEEVETDDNDYEYHIFPKSRRAEIDEINKNKDDDREYKQICELSVDKKDDNYEWVWWRRKTKGDVANKAKTNGIKTFGWWDILNNKKSKQKNIDFNGVSIAHLDTIFALLRHYYKRSIEMEAVVAKTLRTTNKTMLVELNERKQDDPTMLNVTYCQGGQFIPLQIEVDIFIHGEKEHKEEKEEQKELYELTWWNGKKKTECNAIAIKNKTVTLYDSKKEAIKEKYYMRICTNHIQKNIEWEWYDNDRACYEDFKDYIETADANEYKYNLLHKQLEAIFQSNIDTNYPWKFFDRLDPNEHKNRHHSFNNAQMTHLRYALEENDLHFNTAGYLVRFVRLHAPKDVQSEFDINTILNMEQIAVTNEATTFSRNIRRMIDGKNSLSLIYANSNVFINSWLQNYLLSSKAQRLYFWSFILCIATKIKQIDIELENQLVTIPQYEAFLSAKKTDALAFDGGEVRDEQNDVVLYPGFLVPPILDGETATDQTGALSKNTVLNFKKKRDNLSKTRILRKAMVQHTLTMTKNEERDQFLWYQTSKGEQYRDSVGVMLRFGELIRKFILETKHLKDDTSLWPYYKNYFHRNDHQSYHTLINRFNLSLMFSRDDMYQLLAEESIQHNNPNDGCFSHFSCTPYDHQAKPELNQSARMRSKEVAIRHQRKVAAQLILQKWDSLRNLNILRHQLGPLLKVVMEDAHAEEEEFDETLQKRLIKVAKEYDMNKWRSLINITNNRLKNNLDNIETGWQLLSEYDIHRVDSMEIAVPQYPFFESFMTHFLLNYLNKERKEVKNDLSRIANEQSWYPKFKQSWTITPDWWVPNHDMILMELALKHGDAWHKYGRELQGDNASNYMMRLRLMDEEDDEKQKSEPKSRRTKSRPYVHGHTLRSVSVSEIADGINPASEEIQDELRPYLEFQHWCRQKSNILHRLKYITNTIIHNLTEIKPSLIEIRIPHKSDQPQFSSQSHIFSEYESTKHLQYVERETKLPHVTDDTEDWTRKHAQSGADVDVKGALSSASGPSSPRISKKLTTKHNTEVSLGLSGISKMYSENLSESAGTIKIKKTVSFEMDSKESKENEGTLAAITPQQTPNITPVLGSRRESEAITRYNTDMMEEDADNDDDDDAFEKKGRAHEEEQYWSDEEKTEMRIHDPFIHRNFLSELEEVMHSFNMIKYGPYMARFIINEIREYNIPELWDALAVVMEAIPFPMGLSILNEQMRHLRRSKPEQLFQVCKEMVDGTNFGVAAALRMAQYFRKVSKSDSFQETVWLEKSIKFEKKAHELINDIESDHLLYILLTIPLYDTSESMSILSLALEQNRVSFLNNDRILGIMKHVWYHSAAIHVEDDIEPRDFGWGESLQILFFQPFKFYMSPVGFNWTIDVFYLLYLLFVVSWSYAVIKGKDPEIGWMLFWASNAGFVAYEIAEFSDKGRQYFSVTGIMNVWDIIISIIWIVLFIIFFGERARQHFDIHEAVVEDTTNAPYFINTNINATIFSSTVATVSTFFFTTEEESPSEFINNFRGQIREIFSFLWAVQLFFVSTRFLTLFQNTKYLGSLLKIVQKMFTEIVKFFSVAIVVVAAYTFGFYFIFGFNLVNINGEENDPAQDFWPTILFTFDEFIAGGTGEFTDNHVVPFFAIFITVIGFLVLTNMLIALMTTEYEQFQEKAILEIAYMWTETCYDLAHRDRLMPPPFNLLAHACGLLMHIVFISPCACCCGVSDFNLYTQFGHKTYNNLNSCYCGCNKAHKQQILESLPENDLERDGQKIFLKQARKIYGDRFTTFLSFSGWMYFRDIIILKCLKDGIFCCCSKACDDCCIPKKPEKDPKLRKSKSRMVKNIQKEFCYRPKKCFRKCCCNDYDEEAASLTAYHKGCYNCIKLRVKDKVIQGQDTTTIRGISMKKYIERFEEKHKTKLHKEDKILLKHLTVDTLFCDQCYQPYLEKDVNKVLLSPFRVLLDYISCVVFLFTAWLPLVLFFSVLAAFEHCTDSANDSIQAKTETSDKNEYEQFDREYFPQPLHQIIE